MSATTVGTPDNETAHEHALRLVQVDYDDSGRSISEFECSSCGAVWFD